MAKPAPPEEREVRGFSPVEDFARPTSCREERPIPFDGPIRPLGTDYMDSRARFHQRVGFLDEPRIRGRLARRDQTNLHSYPRGCAPRTPPHAPSRAAASARSARVARSPWLARIVASDLRAKPASPQWKENRSPHPK